MDKVRLGDVATYINGYAFKPEDWGEVGKPIIRIQDLTGSSYQTNRFDGDVPSKYIVVAGDVLISWSASLGVYVWSGEDAVLNQHIFKVVFDKVNVDKSFFIHQVGGILDKAASDTHGATMKHLTKPVFDNLPFYLPEIHEQRNISRLLDKTASLITERRQQLTALDTLIKARFVEMFGDPISNPKGWDSVRLLELGSCKNGMNFHTDDAGVEVHCLGVGDFKDKSVISDTSVLPLVSLNEMPSGEYLLQDGDIVFVRSNGNKALVGRCLAVFPGQIQTTFSGFCIRFRKSSHKVTTEYLIHVLKTESMRKKMQGRGANIQNLNQQILGSLSIPVPPVDIQNRFSECVSQIDKSKAVVQKGLDEAQMLFDSLMQQYFG